MLLKVLNTIKAILFPGKMFFNIFIQTLGSKKETLVDLVELIYNKNHKLDLSKQNTMITLINFLVTLSLQKLKVYVSLSFIMYKIMQWFLIW